MTNNRSENSGNKAGLPRRSRVAKAGWLSLLIFPLLLLANGCHRDDVKVYHVGDSQNQMSAPAVSALPAGHPDISSAPAVAGPADPELTWTTPAGWTEVPAAQMRVASFKVSGANGKEADVSVIPLGGMAGTDDANVNRWRGQVGLAPVSSDELQKSAEKVEAGGQSAQLYDIAGATNRIIGVIQHRDDTAWFYKMTGDTNLVEQQKPAFIAFIKSLKFPALPAAVSAMDMPATMPPGHPAIGDMTTPAAAAGPISHEGQPNWKVPAGWQEVAAGQFLIAKFNLTGDAGATAAVNVSMSAGDGGGLAANVNRWRGQLGLAPVTDVTTSPLDITGGKAQLVELSGTNPQTSQPAQLVGVMVSQAGQTWFYKLMGDAKVVAAQKAAFTQFVQSAKYPDAH